MEDSKSGTKLNYKYFIKMALQRKISWETLLVFLDDLTPTLVQSKQAIEVLVKELQILQSKQQGRDLEDDEIVEIVEIMNTETSNVSKEMPQSSAVDLIQTKENSNMSQSEKDGSGEDTDIRIQEVVSQNNEVNLTDNCPDTCISEKEVSEAVEVIQLDDDEELPNQVIQRNCNESNDNENDLTKESESSSKLSFQINGEDCSIEFEESNAAFDSLNEIEKAIDNSYTSYDLQALQAIGDENTSMNSVPTNELTKQNDAKQNDNYIRKPYQCKSCPKCFKYPFDLKRHERFHTGVKPFQCKTCSKAFYQSSDYKRHERTHTDEKAFQCKTCSKSFFRAADLKRHERNHNAVKSFQCKTCLKAFHQSSDYKRHERTHTGERPFQCKTCLKGFRQKYHLQVHKKTHTDEKPFQCKTCSNSFINASVLKRHEKTHTNEKPFQCKTCSKSFYEPLHLKRHERTHSGEKPFQCKTCSKRFSQAGVLTRHERTHTGEKPFRCKTCLKSFNQKAHLQNHEQSIHTAF